MNDGTLRLDQSDAAFMEAIRSPHDLPETATSAAKRTHKRLNDYIRQFEDQLDAEHEIGARLVSFGANVSFHITEIDYWDPDLITFTGCDSGGNKVQLIQNIGQLSVLLIAMKKRGDTPCRIGFIQSER